MQSTPYRPTFPPEQKSDWESLIDFAREKGPTEVLQGYLKTLNGKKESVDFKQDGLDYVISSESERVKTLEELLEAGEVDTERYEVQRYVENKWDQHSVDKGLVELFQVKAWLKNKYLDEPDVSFYEDWLTSVSSDVATMSFSDGNYEKDKIIAIADLHVGSFIENEILVPDYNIEEVRARLGYISHIINENYSEKNLHIKFLGDFIESFSGKNHNDTWLQIEKHGMECVLIAFDLITEFLDRLNNVASIDVVGGNHDRVTASNKEDKRGQAAYLIAELLKRNTNVPIRFDHRVLTSVHDDVCYIITHGDKKITKMEPSKMVLEYGKQDLFNVMLNAHGHQEKIHDTSVRYVSQQIPPVVVPNVYALDNGWTSPSGFAVFSRSVRGGVDKKIYAL